MKQEMDMGHIELIDYIEATELADEQFDSVDAPAKRVRRSAETSSPILPSDDELRATGAVVEGNVLAFTQGMSRQNKEDIMDSFLFASLAANKAFNQKTHRKQWYDKYTEVLTVLGWVSTNWNYEESSATAHRFTMEQAGLEVISSIIAAATMPATASVAMLKVAADTVEALKVSDKPLRLFERQSKSSHGGSVRIVTCNESEDGTVTVVLAVVSFAARVDVTNVLFWEWNHTDVETYKEGDGLALNARHYSTLREAVQKKLGGRGLTAIEEFEI